MINVLLNSNNDDKLKKKNVSNSAFYPTTTNPYNVK